MGRLSFEEMYNYDLCQLIFVDSSDFIPPKGCKGISTVLDISSKTYCTKFMQLSFKTLKVYIFNS